MLESEGDSAPTWIVLIELKRWSSREGVFIACWCRTDVRPAVSMRFTYGHLIQELVLVRVTWLLKYILFPPSI